MSPMKKQAEKEIQNLRGQEMDGTPSLTEA